MRVAVSSAVKQLAAILCALACLAAAGSSATAASATASGPSALGLAAVVALHGLGISAFDRRALSRLFGGSANFFIPRVNKITVTADSIACTMSNVDITARSCDLAFKGRTRTVRGREANEVYGTLALAGVSTEGAAGSIKASIMNLACTIDPVVIKQKAGGGADCTFDTAN